MTTLTVFKNKDGIEIIIDIKTGESFASVNAYARMAGKSKSTISERLQGVREEDKKTIKVYTAGGLQGVRVISEDLMVEWLPKDNPKITSDLLKLGIRGFLHEVSGYKVTSTAIAQSQSQTKPRYQLGMVREEPKDWSEHFDTEFRFHSCRLTKYEWNWKCMAGFINATVYSYLPEEARAELDRVNPCVNGQRPNKQHQHLNIDQDLKLHIEQVKVCMRLSPSLQDFWVAMEANFYGALQLDLF